MRVIDRSIVYPGAIPLDSDILNIQQRTMVAIGAVLRATFGTSTLVDGLLCTPTNPASMSVVVGQGSIISSQPLEPQTYGSLPVDVSDALIKQGINVAATTFALTAPTVSGQTINYLIQCAFQEVDAGPVVLPYYNSSNPSQPYSGPGNSGAPQNTVRSQIASLEVKAGAPAAAGSQTTPPVDSGYVGLWIVTVNYGAVAIYSANISMYPGAPFIQAKLGGLVMRRRLLGNLVLNVSPTGNDSIAAQSGGASPFKTIQAAVNFLYNNIDLNGYAVAIGLAAGTYNESVLIQGTMVGAPPGYALAINGAGSNGESTISAIYGNALQVSAGAQVIIGNLAVSATSSNTSQPYLNQGYGLRVTTGANVGINQGCVFKACSLSQICSAQGGYITTAGNPYAIAGGGLYHMITADSGVIVIVNSSITITGSPSFGSAFVYAYGAASLEAWGGTSFTGATTGSAARYVVSTNASISVNGLGANLFPGASAGVAATGGVYQ